jgi:hypothetical protein
MDFNTTQTQTQNRVFVQDSNPVLRNARLSYHKRSYFPEFEKLAYFYMIYTP